MSVTAGTVIPDVVCETIRTFLGRRGVCDVGNKRIRSDYARLAFPLSHIMP
jgi:hypothetical protein